MQLKETINVSDVNKSEGYLIESNKFHDEILVYYSENNFYAVSSFCPHFGGPLAFTGKDIRCYWHGWRFNLISYKCSNRQVNCKLKNYKVIKKGKILEIYNGN